VGLPLRLDPDGAAIQLIPVLERQGDRLRSVGMTWGGFMPLHSGDGGWRPPPATLGASRTGNGKHSSLFSLSGAGLAQLSDDAARKLLAATLAKPGPPRAHGLTDLDSARPPLLLIYLLLKTPAERRVSLHQSGRIGIGVIDRRSRSLAIVSVRSPWLHAGDRRHARARWRLDAYGNDTAARGLQALLAEWRELQRSGGAELVITSDEMSDERSDPVRLRFDWSADIRADRRP
jgi:hypothetical protein